MKNNKWAARALGCLLAASLAPLINADQVPAIAADSLDNTVQAFSTPSKKSSPSFTEVGIIKEVLVKPGDAVKVGQILAREDSEVDELQYAADKIAAESTAEIVANTDDRDAKKTLYENKQKAAASVSTSELLQAKLEYLAAEARLTYSQEQQAEKQAALAREAKKIEKMKLLSPVDGIVKQINFQPGDVVDPAKPGGAMIIVTNSPLWVDMHVRSAQAEKLKVGDVLSASYVNDASKWFDGTVIFMDPDVDATSDSQTVRLQLDNAEGKPSGLLLNVKLQPH